MKCVQLFKKKISDTGAIIRVSDERAAEIVGNKDGMYVPKKLWKEKVRDVQVDS